MHLIVHAAVAVPDRPVVSQRRLVHPAEPADGLCVEVNNGTATPGELVDEFTCDTAAGSQQWVEGLRSVGGVPHLTFTHGNTGLCLDPVGGAGSKIMQWPCAGNDAPTWTVR